MHARQGGNRSADFLVALGHYSNLVINYSKETPFEILALPDEDCMNSYYLHLLGLMASFAPTKKKKKNGEREREGQDLSHVDAHTDPNEEKLRSLNKLKIQMVGSQKRN